MRFYLLALGILGVWRITHLLQAEDGPWDLTVRFRRVLGKGFFGKLLDCFACASLWVAAPFAVWLGDDNGQRLLLWLALSGGALLPHRATDRSPAPPGPPPPARGPRRSRSISKTRSEAMSCCGQKRAQLYSSPLPATAGRTA